MLSYCHIGLELNRVLRSDMMTHDDSNEFRSWSSECDRRVERMAE